MNNGDEKKYKVSLVSVLSATKSKIAACVLPIVPTSNGKRKKEGKAICRIYGRGSEISTVNRAAVKVCEMLNSGQIDESIFQDQKHVPAQKLMAKISQP